MSSKAEKLPRQSLDGNFHPFWRHFGVESSWQAAGFNGLYPAENRLLAGFSLYSEIELIRQTRDRLVIQSQGEPAVYTVCDPEIADFSCTQDEIQSILPKPVHLVMPNVRHPAVFAGDLTWLHEQARTRPLFITFPVASEADWQKLTETNGLLSNPNVVVAASQKTKKDHLRETLMTAVLGDRAFLSALRETHRLFSMDGRGS